MTVPYNHRAVEKKWHDIWEEHPVNVDDGKKPKYYCLDMFPYPSGNGLHVGHWRGYVISDVWSRYKLLNGYYIIQDPARFCFGMDAVLLSGFARARRGERVLDLGTGTGIIPILMEAKTEAEDFTALEIQEESADMARRSVLYNHLEEKIRVVTGDIKDASGIFGASSFDIVTTNPPYMIGQHGISSGSEAKAIARHEVLCTLDDILRESAKLLVPGGRFYMVHRPFRLAEIMSKMVACGIEPKRMQLVYPYVDKEPNMVLLEGSRGGRSRLTVEKPLIVYKEQGVYTDEIYDIYGY